MSNATIIYMDDVTKKSVYGEAYQDVCRLPALLFRRQDGDDSPVEFGVVSEDILKDVLAGREAISYFPIRLNNGCVKVTPIPIDRSKSDLERFVNEYVGKRVLVLRDGDGVYEGTVKARPSNYPYLDALLLIDVFLHANLCGDNTISRLPQQEFDLYALHFNLISDAHIIEEAPKETKWFPKRRISTPFVYDDKNNPKRINVVDIKLIKKGNE